MNVLLFGATGMVGQGVLLECLRDADVGRVLAVGRRPTGQAHEKLRDLVVTDPGRPPRRRVPAGTDSSERGRVMWARVKGRTENALLALPFKAAYMFRPAYIQPLDGIRSSTRWYRVAYAAIAPLYPLLKRLFPAAVTTTAQLGRAMLAVARHGFDRQVLETRDINGL